MPIDPATTAIYHITDVSNLPGILQREGLQSDRAMAGEVHTRIGYDHIKLRRLSETRIACCGDRFVGEFVPFYYCPRSPMLFVLNQGRTGRPVGCQQTVIHLVSTVADAIGLKRDWAISDGNAGAAYPSFYNELRALEQLDWDAIGARSWQGRTNQKSAEFLVADFFPFTAIRTIGCYNSTVANEVAGMLAESRHRPTVLAHRDWYYP